ncbi:hypothetical protein TNCV_3087281 [Trichonephila clavipes]|nr:hypothetical protein TNCV_3087281 [Trichonephila clavipes]
MQSARDQSPSLPIDVLGISLQRVPHVEAWRVGCHLSSPPRHSTGVPNDTVCMCVELVTLSFEDETDQAIEEPDEIMHINRDSESKYDKSDRHETFELNCNFQMLPKELYQEN